MLILLVATALAAFGAGYVNQTNWDPTASNVVLLVIGVVWLVIVGWLTLWPFLNWWTTHFVITDRRVMFRHGLLTRSGIDIPLARINSVEFRHGLFDRILRTGTLIIESASQDPLEFNDIPRVERVHSLLYHEVFDTLGGEESDSQSSRQALTPSAPQRCDVGGLACVVRVLHRLGDAAGREGGLDRLVRVAAELVGEHPAAERPEPERPSAAGCR